MPLLMWVDFYCGVLSQNQGREHFKGNKKTTQSQKTGIAFLYAVWYNETSEGASLFSKERGRSNG
jgi:hypothetical protein